MRVLSSWERVSSPKRCDWWWWDKVCNVQSQRHTTESRSYLTACMRKELDRDFAKLDNNPQNYNKELWSWNKKFLCYQEAKIFSVNNGRRKDWGGFSTLAIENENKKSLSCEETKCIWSKKCRKKLVKESGGWWIKSAWRFSGFCCVCAFCQLHKTCNFLCVFFSF